VWIMETASQSLYFLREEIGGALCKAGIGQQVPAGTCPGHNGKTNSQPMHGRSGSGNFLFGNRLYK
jgi:hypothetical protein